MITLTERAALRVKVQIMNRELCYGIKVGVKTTGCSGMAYMLEYADQLDPIDLCFRSNGVNIYVNPQHLPYLDGLVMDWKKEGLNEGFAFENPNSQGECGCGESFSV